MNTWNDYLAVMGGEQFGREVSEFIGRMCEAPDIAEPLGEVSPSQTSSYRFFASGVELGFRDQKLNHVHFFMQSHEGYLPYQGDFLGCPAQYLNKSKIVDALGEWKSSGGGTVRPLIGYVFPWIKYEYGDVTLRFEFAADDTLWLASLMRM